jgi:purine-binding chemotaxis protein CheW
MEQVSTFRIGKALYGINILHIKEISKIFDITPVPEAPPHIIGLMNLRGQIVSIIDPEYFWTEKSSLHGDYYQNRLLILKTDEQLKSLVEQKLITKINMGQDYLGFVIDEVANVIETQPKDLAEPPPHLKIRDFVQGILQLESEVVTVFNTEKLVAKAVKVENKMKRKKGGPK